MRIYPDDGSKEPKVSRTSQDVIAMPRTACTARTTALASASVAAIFGLSACGHVDLTADSMANTYSCNDTVVVSGDPVTWIDEMKVTSPREVQRTSSYWAAWLQLVRVQNHFGGADRTTLSPGLTIEIPRRCRANETSPRVSPTLGVDFSTPPAQNS